MRVHTGAWTLTPKTQNIKVLDLDWRVNVNKEKIAQDTTTTLQVIQSTISLFPDRFLEYSKLLLKYAGIPLVLVGLFGIFRNRNMLISGLIIFLLLPLFGMNVYNRFMLPYIPLLAIFTLISLKNIKRIEVIYLICCIIMLGVLPIYDEITQPEEKLTELREAGLAISSIVKKADILLDRKPYTAFYAGGRYRQIPNEPLDTVVVFCRRTNAQFLVLAERVVGVFRPQLRPLLYDDAVCRFNKLETVYSHALQTGYGVKILKIVQ